jgi:lambda family phage minor tail protein L
MTLEADVQQGWHDAIVELFDLDLEPITGDPQDKFYFTTQLKPDEAKIVWQGRTYEPLPILAAGYERSTTGQVAQPSLTVANVLGTFTHALWANILMENRKRIPLRNSHWTSFSLNAKQQKTRLPFLGNLQAS